MKFREFKNFREYDRTFVKVTNMSNNVKRGLKVGNLEDPLYGILYIDKQCGATLRVLGNKNKFIPDKILIIRYTGFDDMDFEIFEGTNGLKNILVNQINKIYYDEDINKLLDDSRLDEFRYDPIPNDVRVLLLSDDKVEWLWVRLMMKIDKDDFYVGELLNTSQINKNYVEKTKVALVYHEHDNQKLLIIDGLVKFKNEE